MRPGPGARAGRRTRFRVANDLIQIFPREFFNAFHMQYFLLQDPNMLDNPRIRYSVQELDKSALQV